VLTVKISRLCPLLAAVCFTVCALAYCQFGAAEPAGSASKSVVVIDMGKVFKEHVRFKQQMDVLKKDMEAFQAFARSEDTKLRDRAEKLKSTYQKGSPEYKREEEAITRQASELQLQGATKQKDLMEREAKVYYNVYNEVATAVATFADAQRISLVLRYNSDPINPDDRNSVLAGVNNMIVFQRNLDITNIIIEEVNRGTFRGTANSGSKAGPSIPKGKPTENR
jgi:Skp family chaperone for outer membrane proteins